MQNSWQQVKHAKPDSDILNQAFTGRTRLIALGSHLRGPYSICNRGTSITPGDNDDRCDYGGDNDDDDNDDYACLAGRCT